MKLNNNNTKTITLTEALNSSYNFSKTAEVNTGLYDQFYQNWITEGQYIILKDMLPGWEDVAFDIYYQGYISEEFYQLLMSRK